MKNWKHPPLDSEIAQYVDCYWFLEKTNTDISHDSPRLNPYPEAHLILAPIDQPYHYTMNEIDTSGFGPHLLLPSKHSVQLHHADPFMFIGVKFRVGAFYSLSLTSDQPQLNQIIENPDFFGSFNASLIDQASNTSTSNSIHRLCAMLDEWLRPLLVNAHEDKFSKLVRTTLSLLKYVEIAALNTHLHCSRRTIERSFLRVTGLTLKQYNSMRTLDDLLTYLHRRKENSLDWSDIAAKFGFSDQPHLIRYLKSTIQATPNNYLKQRDLTIDVYGDFEE
ncbi:AraC family transcriptional regulator [Endozoicomonas sp. OPT23]|uniref:AraC family transcriptional regulator n=1 Tax=Endozoicomonas sp. OPT23 TaxID=2072845 RepID=UPI00129A0ED2|nr:helix-turn-helix domain-containing protein [Endozoicomonas sp. OPT23]MRI31478.1 AraC family transcriptional regulator [Endozoicomonas sp. OPT23]